MMETLLVEFAQLLMSGGWKTRPLHFAHLCFQLLQELTKESAEAPHSWGAGPCGPATAALDAIRHVDPIGAPLGAAVQAVPSAAQFGMIVRWLLTQITEQTEIGQLIIAALLAAVKAKNGANNG